MQRHHRSRHRWMWIVILVVVTGAVVVGLSVRTGDLQPPLSGEVR